MAELNHALESLLLRHGHGLALHLLEAVEVELPDEAGPLVVLEELRYDGLGQAVGIPDEEGGAIRGPAGDGGIARVDHCEGF